MKIYSQIVLGGCKTKHHWIICSRRLWGAFWFSNTNYLPLTLYILDTQMIWPFYDCAGEDHPVLNQHPATPLQHRCFRGLHVKQTSDIWPFWGIYLLSANITYPTSYFWGLHAISNIQLWKRQALASDENHARYWSEWESRTIYKADKFSGKNVTAITGHLVTPQSSPPLSFSRPLHV